MYRKPGTYLNALLLSAPRTYAAVAALARAPSELLPEVLAIVASKKREQPDEMGANTRRGVPYALARGNAGNGNTFRSLSTLSDDPAVHHSSRLATAQTRK